MQTGEKKLTKRALQALETKKRIYEAGVELFKEYGYDTVSVEDIVGKANVGIGTFYHYYKSKQELYIELFVHAEDYFSELEQIDAKEEPEIFFQKYFDRYRQLNEDMGLEFMYMIALPSGRAFLENNLDFEVNLQKIIENYQKKGKVRTDLTSAELCEYLLITARGVILQWQFKAGDYDLKGKMDFFMKLAVQTILKK